jgi:hypothetical protein
VFLQKRHVEKFPEKIDKNFDVSFPSAFLVLARFRVFLPSAMEIQNTQQKNGLQKQIVSKSFYKKTKIRSRFLSKILYHVFGRFSVRGVQSTIFLKKRKDKSDPGPFLASDPPTHHGGHRLFFGGPLTATATTGLFRLRLRPRPPLSLSIPAQTNKGQGASKKQIKTGPGGGERQKATDRLDPFVLLLWATGYGL